MSEVVPQGREPIQVTLLGSLLLPVSTDDREKKAG
jgi:hypothetical protein